MTHSHMNESSSFFILIYAKFKIHFLFMTTLNSENELKNGNVWLSYEGGDGMNAAGHILSIANGYHQEIWLFFAEKYSGIFNSQSIQWRKWIPSSHLNKIQL